MPLTIDIAGEAQAPEVKVLDLSALGPDDYLNLILQRSEVMYDIPKAGQVIRAWNAGDLDPIARVVETLGDAIARRAAGVIRAEYRAVAPHLRDIKPKRIADIGCGYAFFDLFAAQDLKADVVLIDLEVNEHRHFGFQSEGAAYSSLAVARKILEDNGISAKKITTLNPRDTAPETVKPVDLAVSFLSCGFHYPVDLYLPFLDRALKPGGSAILDLREATAEAQSATLAPFGALSTLAAPNKARRVLLKKTAR